jgi:hypothetical protein
MAKRPAASPAPQPIALGPWPLGVDNVHASDHAVFQVGGEAPARLVAASNLDLDDTGRLYRRPGLVTALADLVAVGAWEVAGRHFLQDGDGTLWEVRNGVAVAVVQELVRRPALVAHAGLIYGSDGTTHFELDGTTVRTWGLPVPIIRATYQAGAGFDAGRYQVQATFSDARGNQGGASSPVEVVLAAAGGIAVELSPLSLSAGATHLNIYAGRANQPVPSFVAQVALAALPYVATSLAVSAGDIARTEYMGGPAEGLVGLVSHRAYLCAWRDDTVFRSEPQEPHLFDYERHMLFNHPVQACESVAGGLWVGTTGGLVWVAGEGPETWIPSRRTKTAVAKGSLLIEGHKLPALETADLVALFCTASGLVAGLPGGGVVHLSDGRYHFDPGARVSLAYVERGELRQILIGVVP